MVILFKYQFTKICFCRVTFFFFLNCWGRPHIFFCYRTLPFTAPVKISAPVAAKYPIATKGRERDAEGSERHAIVTNDMKVANTQNEHVKICLSFLNFVFHTTNLEIARINPFTWTYLKSKISKLLENVFIHGFANTKHNGRKILVWLVIILCLHSSLFKNI